MSEIFAARNFRDFREFAKIREIKWSRKKSILLIREIKFPRKKSNSRNLFIFSRSLIKNVQILLILDSNTFEKVKSSKNKYFHSPLYKKNQEKMLLYSHDSRN